MAGQLILQVSFYKGLGVAFSFKKLAFPTNSTVKETLGLIVSKCKLSREPEEFALYHNKSRMDETKQLTTHYGLKINDTVEIRPKHVMSFQFPDDTTVTFNIDFKTPISTVLSTLFGSGEHQRDIDSYTLYDGDEALDLSQSFSEQNVRQNATVFFRMGKPAGAVPPLASGGTTSSSGSGQVSPRSPRGGGGSQINPPVGDDKKKKHGILSFGTRRTSVRDMSDTPAPAGFGSPVPAKREEHPKDSPLFFIEALKQTEHLNSQVVNSLLAVIDLQFDDARDAWISSFIEAGGFNQLFGIVARIDNAMVKLPAELGLLYDCLVVIQRLMNTEAGLHAVISKRFLRILCFQLNSTNENQKKMVLHMLAAACLVPPHGHAWIVESFSDYAKQKDKERFSQLVPLLKDNVSFEFKACCMTLINAIVNTPEDIDTRVNLRDDFVSLGLTKVMKDLKKSGDAELNTQIELFENEMKYDTEQINQIARSTFMVDIDDLNGVFSNLKESCMVKEELTSLLQRLMVIPQDQSLQVKIWSTVNKLAEKAAAMKPDDDPSTLFVSQEDLVALRLSYDEQLNQLNQQIATLNEKLAQAPSAGASDFPPLPPPPAPPSAELSAELASAQATIESLTAEITNLREELSAAREAATAAVAEAAEAIAAAKANAIAAPPAVAQEGSISSESSGETAPTSGEAATAGESTSESTPGSGAPAPPPPPPVGGAPPPPPPGGAPKPPGPPPPPPPGGKGGPPPPPPAKKAIMNVPAASVKMKRLNWSKIPTAKSAKTIWNNLGDQPVPINFKQLESLFAAEAPKTPETARPAGTSAAAARRNEQRKVVTLLDPKRTNQVGIMLANLRLPFEAIKNAIINCDDSVLSSENLKSIANAMPTPEEEETLNEWKDKSSLAKAEQFLIEMISVPRLKQRLNACIYTQSFPQLASELKQSVSSVLLACNELKNSKKLPKILEVVLAIGNFLNGGTNKGEAIGFKLDFLLKMGDTKSVDNKTTLLHHLTTIIESSFSTYVNFMEELPHLEAASKVSAPLLREQLSGLKKGLQEVIDDLSNATSPSEANYASKLRRFLDSAESEVTKLIAEEQEMIAAFKATATLYGEDPDITGFEEFFSIFTKFGVVFERGLREQKERRAAADLKARRMEQQASRAAAAAPPSPTPPRTRPVSPRATPTGQRGALAIGKRPGAPGEGGEGAMDQVLTRLRKGTVAFDERRTRQATFSAKGMERNELVNLLCKVKKGREEAE